jgi:hypothetical protein
MEVDVMTEQNKNEHTRRDKPLSFISMVIITGLVGGILWSAVGLLAYVFSFTEVHPRVILEPWTIGEWKKGWLGTVISLAIIGVISIGVAFVYYAILKKFKSIWIGVGYGVVLFLLVFIVLNPIFPSIKPFSELGRNTIITTACLYILYGVFIGYSISYEETEQENSRKKHNEAAT